VELSVFIAIFVLVLLAAVGGVVREGNHGHFPDGCLGLGRELEGEHVGEVVELLLEVDLEEAGVAGPAEPRKEVFGVVAEEEVVAQDDEVEVAVEAIPAGRVEGFFKEEVDVLVADGLVVARSEHDHDVAAEHGQLGEEVHVALPL
jgi:hypothetical protein